MGTAYSQDLRDRVIAARDRGIATKQVADLFRVSPAWIRQLTAVEHLQSHAQPLPPGTPCHPADA